MKGKYLKNGVVNIALILLHQIVVALCRDTRKRSFVQVLCHSSLEERDAFNKPSFSPKRKDFSKGGEDFLHF